MNTVEKMLTGEIEMKEFVVELKSNVALQEYVKELVPQEARNNPNHELWLNYSYIGMLNYGFDCLEHMKSLCSFDGSMGDNLNIFSIIARFYSYSHPEIKCTTKYKDYFNLLLDVCGETYDGPEVQDYIEKIFKEVFSSVQGKTKQKKEAKRRILESFHVADKKNLIGFKVENGLWG